MVDNAAVTQVRAAGTTLDQAPDGETAAIKDLVDGGHATRVAKRR